MSTFARVTFSSLSPGWPLTALTAGPDRVDELADRTGKSVVGIDVLDGRLDRAALGVAQHHDEPRAEHANRELDAPLDRGARAADDVAGHAHHKQVAHTLVEDQLGCHSRVCATDDHRHGCLSLGQSREFFRLAARVDQLPGYESLVTLEQPCQYGVGCRGRGRLAAAPTGRWQCQPRRPAASPVSRTNSRREPDMLIPC